MILFFILSVELDVNTFFYFGYLLPVTRNRQYYSVYSLCNHRLQLVLLSLYEQHNYVDRVCLFLLNFNTERKINTC